MTEKQTKRTGQISVQTTDIFPIIKKWLYSEHDIFLRELVSNSTDAITKRAALARTHNVELPTGKIELAIDKDKKTITIHDNGLGMSEDEVEKYIAQLAFSGAEEFVQKMKSENEKGEDIIGKFGLGFYSAFMVSDKVEVDTLSWEEGATPSKWICEGDTEYSFEESQRQEVGTSITLHVNEESQEFLNDWKVVETLRKFCDFMPYSIEVKKNEPPKEKDQPTHWKVNETEPLWKKDPKEVSEEQYKDFYRSLFPMEGEPLFWLHLKVDHPFTLEGILYFPKINPKMSFQEKHIKLYSKQVFVSDNVKNIIPEFLSLLKGVIDSTDIPLNVSRSSLQGDPNIRKISNYVVKKVAESLKKLFKKDRKRFEEIWPDISLFVKYGCISDNKFDEAMRPMVAFKNQIDQWQTVAEYRQAVPAPLKTKLGDKVLYFEKDKGDPNLLDQLKELQLSAFEIDDHIDPHFLQHCEHKALAPNEQAKEQGQEEQKVQFVSVNSEISQLMETDQTTPEDIKIKELFQTVLTKSEPQAANSSKPDQADKPEQKEALDTEKAEKMESPAAEKMEVEIQKFKQATSPAFFKLTSK